MKTTLYPLLLAMLAFVPSAKAQESMEGPYGSEKNLEGLYVFTPTNPQQAKDLDRIGVYIGDPSELDGVPPIFIQGFGWLVGSGATPGGWSGGYSKNENEESFDITVSITDRKGDGRTYMYFYLHGAEQAFEFVGKRLDKNKFALVDLPCGKSIVQIGVPYQCPSQDDSIVEYDHFGHKLRSDAEQSDEEGTEQNDAEKNTPEYER